MSDGDVSPWTQCLGPRQGQRTLGAKGSWHNCFFCREMHCSLAAQETMSLDDWIRANAHSAGVIEDENDVRDGTWSL